MNLHYTANFFLNLNFSMLQKLGIKPSTSYYQVSPASSSLSNVYLLRSHTTLHHHFSHSTALGFKVTQASLPPTYYVFQ